MKARLIEGGAMVLLEGRIWREVFPVGALHGRIQLYRRLRDRREGRYRRHYADTVSALAAIHTKIEAEP